MLRGLEGTRNLVDDVLVFGKTRKEHDERLIKVLQRFEKCGLTCCFDKCKLGVTKIKFFGLELSDQGFAPSDDKFSALTEAAAPANAKELRSFLGLAVFCSTHIPNLASLAAPLWELTRSEVKYEWTHQHDKALKSIKQAIVSDALGYFNTSWLTEIAVDASPVGLAAICCQSDPKNTKNSL